MDGPLQQVFMHAPDGHLDYVFTKGNVLFNKPCLNVILSCSSFREKW